MEGPHKDSKMCVVSLWVWFRGMEAKQHASQWYPTLQLTSNGRTNVPGSHEFSGISLYSEAVEDSVSLPGVCKDYHRAGYTRISKGQMVLASSRSHHQTSPQHQTNCVLCMLTSWSCWFFILFYPLPVFRSWMLLMRLSWVCVCACGGAYALGNDMDVLHVVIEGATWA